MMFFITLLTALLAIQPAAAAPSTTENSDVATKVAAGETPAWLKDRIATFAKSDKPGLPQQPVDPMNVPRAISKVTYQGQDAYLFEFPCCDHFVYLYDSQGSVLCTYGGITGRGDGKCNGPRHRLTQRQRVWPVPMQVSR